jgi:PAS domain S-box-containing protein
METPAAQAATEPVVASPTDADELYDQAPCGYLTATPDGVLVRVNATLLGWTGHRREELVGRRRFVDLLTPGSRIYHETHYAPLLQMQQDVREIAFTMRRHDGSRFPVLVNSRLVPGRAAGEPAVVLTSVFDATNRRRYEEELLAARRRAERAGDRLGLMQRVTLRLAMADGLAQATRVAARSAVEVADAAVAAIWLRDLDRTTYALHARATGPGTERPESSDAVPGSGTQDARAALEPDDVPPLDDLTSLPWGQAERTCPALAQVLGPPAGDGGPVPSGLVLVPLVDGPRRLGVLGCRLDGGAGLGAVESEAMRTLARQAAVALVRARLFEQQRDVAETLQRSLLPPTLPRSPRFSVSRVYVPGQIGTQAGGDWYDAFPLDEDRLAVVVGDVVGRGIHAAATMGQLRSAIRALAPVSDGPAELLTRLDRFVDAVPAATCATVVAAAVDLRTGVLTYACAGHPPPLLLAPDGAVETLWGGRSLPLGLGTAVDRGQEEVTMTPGSRLLLYTDGLVERRDTGLDERIARLGHELGATRHEAPDDQLRSLERLMLGPVHASDDVCLLGLALHQEAAAAT